MTRSHSQALDAKAHFDRVSARWSRNYDSRSGAMRRRIGDFAAVVASLPKGARLLDFGCGTGDITLALSAEGFAMTGIDLSPEMIGIARRQPGAEGTEWAVAQAGVVTLPFADSAFDGALASSVMEYHPDPTAQLAEIARVLHPGGVFAFTVPDMDNPLRAKEEKWRGLATGPLWPMLRMTPRRDYFEYLRVSVNRWPLQRWLEMARAAGLAALPPSTRDRPLAMIIARKPA